MFENLTDKLQRAFKNLRGQGSVTEENMAEALREIRVALLEADVNLNVVKELIEHIREKAMGQEVMTSLSPTEQVVKIVRDELIAILGKDVARFQFASRPPTVILMAGLQGSGKTTTAGKLAAWLQKGGHRPMLVSVDVYRPAAREQLRVVAKAIKANIYEGDEKGEAAGTALVERLAKEARREAVITGCDTLIVDTAGRLHVDDQLMDEMAMLKEQLSPQEILFVADAMTGQDAVKSAEAFHKRLALTGTVLTKMDGDARGGAALSIRHVTGQPVKFIGTGEKPDAFEPFHPDRIVGRILGMGDIMGLIERAEEKLDKKKSEAFALQGADRGRIFAGGLPRSAAADQEAGVDGEHSEDAAVGGAAGRTAADGGTGGREPADAGGGDHQLDDAEGAEPPRDYFGEPEEADRERVGDDGAGSEPAAAAVCADAEDVQGDWEGRRDAAAARDGDAGGDAGAVGKGAGYKYNRGYRAQGADLSGQWSVVSGQMVSDSVLREP